MYFHIQLIIENRAINFDNNKECDNLLNSKETVYRGPNIKVERLTLDAVCTSRKEDSQRVSQNGLQSTL
ncbi:hypothetical protein scyTo_0008600 [Scyliorhinus torazame]|uniref:Uncharacterized protein n=1 Tax=Scyliorhinus torazame TaxID=75743 RepID=A0A401PBM6_SCYTO|nr:hypothetical protein [Scyliorhinus torazame]